MNSFYDAFISRNIGCFSPADQQKLTDSCVAIAGVGGVGGLVAERLVRLGVTRLTITDPGTFEESNLNRQFGCTSQTIGEYKTTAVSNELLRINPSLAICGDTRGIISQKSADDFVANADIVVDAMDYPMFMESTCLARAARASGLYYMFSSAIGFGTTITIFDPQGFTLEEYNGLQPGVDLMTVHINKTSFEGIYQSLPGYLLETLGKENAREMIAGTKPITTNSIGVGSNSILVANEVVNCLLQRKPVICAPHYLHLDLLDRTFEIKNILE